ncbi:MAG: type II toxin-antitoxin system HicB family antitoxin [bacterium]
MSTRHIKVEFERDEDGMYVATCPFLPGCISQGKTEREALKNIKEAIRLHIRALAEDGLPIFNRLFFLYFFSNFCSNTLTHNLFSLEPLEFT